MIDRRKNNWYKKQGRQAHRTLKLREGEGKKKKKKHRGREENEGNIKKWEIQVTQSPLIWRLLLLVERYIHIFIYIYIYIDILISWNLFGFWENVG